MLSHIRFLIPEGIFRHRSLGYAGVNVRLHGVHQEAELVAQRLVAVGHADLGHVRPPDVVAPRSVLQVV